MSLVVTRLSELEETIERGLATFVEVGQALLEIRDERLYHRDEGGDYTRWEDYCRERWGFGRNYANKTIQAAEIAGRLEVMGTTVPTSEREARELAPLREKPEQMAEAWQEANDNGKPTAEKVKEAVSRRIEPGRGFTGYSSATDEWATPQDFFDVLDAEFNFNLDVCALDSSAKCENYFTPEDDGLAQEWTGTCWMNPPYGDEISKWVTKAHEAGDSGATVVCLVPARVDTAWWHDHCAHGEIRILRGRLSFGEATTNAPFPSAVVIFGRKPNMLNAHWNWRNG